LRRGAWGGIRIARTLSETYSLNLCPGTINHWIYGDRKPRLRNIFRELPSPALSYIIGANKGDGCTITKSGVVKLEVTDRDFAEEFNSCMAQLFSRAKPNRILTRRFDVKRLPLYIVKYSSVQLTSLLRMPLRRILRLALVYPQDFLRGFFDAEGSVDVSAKTLFRYQIGAENTNITLLREVKRVLQEEFGIQSVLDRKREPGAPKRIRGESFMTKRTSFAVLIRRLSGMRSFAVRIGFSIGRKQVKLQDAIRVLQLYGREGGSLAWNKIYYKSNGEWIRSCHRL